MAEEVQDVLYPKLCDESLSTYEMSDHGFVRETYPNLMRSVEWRSLVINTGASHGTLQDIKLPEYSGGYTFEVAGARRTLLWRVTHDTLQLTEESTDVQLANAHLRLQFPDSPVLEGISAHQTPTSLVLLVATVASVHRLRMTLPAGGEGHCAAAAGSLLQQLTAQQLRQPDSMHVLQAQANAPAAHTAAAGLLPSGEAVFFLAGAAGGGQVVRYLSGGPGPLAAAHHLQPASVVGRLWGLFADPSQQRVDAALVLAPGEPAAPEPAVAAVCRDGRLRLWSVARRTALAELDLLEFLAERGPAGARRHGLRRRRGAGPPLLAAHLSLVGQQVFVLVRAAATRAAWSLQYVATVCAPDHALIDYALTE
ncbi:nuclear pore complex protein Nup160 homolog, partial [Amphibalanus amphitrite]|uniref:nuclear pore complex protein Nup160 homolog n=1 Tax=Amphibalanus amphitrite TaxID=1232801 RepID=UPI001C928545